MENSNLDILKVVQNFLDYLKAILPPTRCKHFDRRHCISKHGCSDCFKIWNKITAVQDALNRTRDKSVAEDLAASKEFALGALELTKERLSGNNKMDVKEIVEQYLKAHGYDGLYDDHDCGCKVDGLMPCGEPQMECQPGYLSHRDGDWVIAPEKPEGENRNGR